MYHFVMYQGEVPRQTLKVCFCRFFFVHYQIFVHVGLMFPYVVPHGSGSVSVHMFMLLDLRYLVLTTPVTMVTEKLPLQIKMYKLMHNEHY